MVWAVIQPKETRSPQALYSELSTHGWFGGLLPADRQGRLGVRVWGKSAVTPDKRQQVALVMGMSQPLPATRVRVRGYGTDFGLPLPDGKIKAAAETQALFPNQEVEVIACHHMKSSGLFRPVWDILVRGIPSEWSGVVVPSRDSRTRDKSWQICYHARGSVPLQALRPRDPTHFAATQAEEGESEEEVSMDVEGEAEKSLSPPVLEDAFLPKEN